jgi:hypothetical protein
MDKIHIDESEFRVILEGLWVNFTYRIKGVSMYAEIYIFSTKD